MPTSHRTEWSVPVGAEFTTAILEPASDLPARGLLVCAHGAGGHLADRGTAAASEALRAAGLDVVRFNFLYRERRSGRPDPMPQLQACFSAVVDRVRSECSPARLLVGGRSMGGRVGSMMAADGLACDGLLLLAYPLHPAGRPGQLRVAHLGALRVPVLSFSGTRDDLCRRDLMKAALQTVTAPWTQHWIEGADHSFHVLKRSGRTDGDVLAEVTAATRHWLDTS